MISFEDDRHTRAEMRLLGALLLDAGAIRHCQHVKPAHFSHELHGAIFAAIRQLIAQDRPVNAVTVHASIRLARRGPRFDVFPYLLTLLAEAGVPAHAGYYAAIMFEGPLEEHECSYAHGDGLCRPCSLLAKLAGWRVNPYKGQP